MLTVIHKELIQDFYTVNPSSEDIELFPFITMSFIAVVYFTNLAALGFGTTVLPGIALADPANNGYISYIIAHLIFSLHVLHGASSSC